MGLQGEYVFDDYILVCGQYGDEGYKPYTKNKEKRTIPLMPEMIALLKNLMKTNGIRQITDDIKAQAAIAGSEKTEKEKPIKETGKDGSRETKLKIVNLPVRKSA